MSLAIQFQSVLSRLSPGVARNQAGRYRRSMRATALWWQIERRVHGKTDFSERLLAEACACRDEALKLEARGRVGSE